jgi:two-component system phosphate regulon sensor histidine kinase PhoR
MIISSIIIILIILTIFTATLIIIFRQKKLSEMKSDFVSNMTHELKTPISTISLASQMLSDDQVSNSKDYIKNISKIIKDETMRLSMQVEKVLQTSIIDKGMLKLKIENIDIHDIIKKILENFEIRVKNENGTIELNLEAQKSIIKADKVHITNVLVNLCENALKYKQEIPEIKIETKNIANSIIINVIDTGIGISKENYKKVFEKFYRVSTGNLHDVKGFGLGLSYVKKIVEEHNGTITLESKLKKGSVFSIKLPLND